MDAVHNRSSEQTRIATIAVGRDLGFALGSGPLPRCRSIRPRLWRRRGFQDGLSRTFQGPQTVEGAASRRKRLLFCPDPQTS